MAKDFNTCEWAEYHPLIDRRFIRYGKLPLWNQGEQIPAPEPQRLLKAGEPISEPSGAESVAVSEPA
jgi:hypothetical protein